MIDTIILCGNTRKIKNNGWFSWLFSKKRNPKEPEPDQIEAAKIQWEWIEKTLRESK